MKHRFLVVAAIVVVGVALVPASAWAKGAKDATITGSPMTDTRPAGKMGPRYRAVYELYASEDTTVTIRQDIYPFATAGFVSYTPPGQQALQKTAKSGWYVTTDTYNTGIDSLRATAMLVALGAPQPHARNLKGSTK